MSREAVVCSYTEQATPAQLELARCEASARGACFWTGNLSLPALGMIRYWVTLPQDRADPLQCLRVTAAVDAALGVTRSESRP